MVEHIEVYPVEQQILLLQGSSGTSAHPITVLLGVSEECIAKNGQ